MNLPKWFSISLFNLFVLSIVGVTLRYKIAFPLEFIDQKHLLHAHSHFAFSGWLTQSLMTLLVFILQKENSIPTKWDQRFLWLNLVSACGMLLCFAWQGYGLFSIFFSTSSILMSYAFGIRIWRRLNEQPHYHARNIFLKAGILFNVLSSFGAFSLAVMMATKTVHQNWYLTSIYFFLHFQYNGWFMMTCFGLFFHQLTNWKMISPVHTIVAWLIVGACIPAFFLSTLWMDLPLWLYSLIIISAMTQLFAWYLLLQSLQKNINLLKQLLTAPVRKMLILITIALTFKLLLQFGSTIPQLSTWAFGYRPIVIGYLHLVLLGVITLFVVAFAIQNKLTSGTATQIKGVWLFIIGIVLNEVILLSQGAGALTLTTIPYSNEGLIGAACTMAIGIAMINFSGLDNRIT